MSHHERYPSEDDHLLTYLGYLDWNQQSSSLLLDDDDHTNSTTTTRTMNPRDFFQQENLYVYHIVVSNWMYHPSTNITNTIGTATTSSSREYHGYPCSSLRNINTIDKYHSQYLIVTAQRNQIYFLKSNQVFDTMSFHRCQQGNKFLFQFHSIPEAETEEEGEEEGSRCIGGQSKWEKINTLSYHDIDRMTRCLRRCILTNEPDAEGCSSLPAYFQSLLTTKLQDRHNPIPAPTTRFDDYHCYPSAYLFYQILWDKNGHHISGALLQFISCIYLVYPQDKSRSYLMMDKKEFQDVVPLTQPSFPRLLYRFIPSLKPSCCGSGNEYYLSMESREWIDCCNEEELKIAIKDKTMLCIDYQQNDYDHHRIRKKKMMNKT